jgi:hypothetical protein
MLQVIIRMIVSMISIVACGQYPLPWDLNSIQEPLGLTKRAESLPRYSAPRRLAYF